jgi:signal transduction histidine kinase
LQAKQCDIFHPSQKKEIAAKWDELFLKMERYAGEVLIKNEAGQYRWHLDITEPIFDQRGNLEMWVGTFTDVHEEFVKEREVKDTRDLLEAVFNASTNGIAVFDSVYDENGQVFDFHWKYSNQQAQRFAEAHMPEGSNLRELFKKSKAESLIETIKRVVESGEPTAFDYQLEKNGSQVWYHAVAVKLEDGIVLTQQDITDRVKAKQNLLNLNETLKEKNRELKTMNEELTNFAFIASHDLREPLRKIQLFAGQLKDRELSNINERANQYVTKILGAVHRMNDLIEDVLTYSRASVSARPKGVEADLNDVLRQVLTDLSEVIREHDALITHNKLPMFKCNALQISQLLQNMVHNALKFQSGDKQPRVEVNAQIIAGETIDSPLVNPEAQYLKLEVSDNGIGFEQQYADKIFGMFQRLHGRAVFPGTGMGLAICRKIAENHKGFIIARSVLGEGATFTCYLPVQPD